MRVNMKKEVLKIKTRSGIYYGEPYKLDEFDKKILIELQENSRQTLADLSKKIHLSRDAIRHRIDKMIKAEVILGFNFTLNPPKVGFPLISYVLLGLQNAKPGVEEEFIRFVKNNPLIIYVASLIGKWDYVLYLVSRNPGELSSILKELRTKFPELIKDYETFTVLEELKYEEAVRAL